MWTNYNVALIFCVLILNLGIDITTSMVWIVLYDLSYNYISTFKQIQIYIINIGLRMSYKILVIKQMLVFNDIAWHIENTKRWPTNNCTLKYLQCAVTLLKKIDFKCFKHQTNHTHWQKS